MISVYAFSTKYTFSRLSCRGSLLKFVFLLANANGFKAYKVQSSHTISLHATPLLKRHAFYGFINRSSTMHSCPVEALQHFFSLLKPDCQLSKLNTQTFASHFFSTAFFSSGMRNVFVFEGLCCRINWTGKE